MVDLIELVVCRGCYFSGCEGKGRGKVWNE